MSDLEQRLARALARGAQDAPAPSALADAARFRARRRRRTRLGAAAAGLALCIAVPAAVVGLRPSSDDARGPDPSGHASGLRVESWHGVSIEVPDSWGYGSLSDWCANGGSLEPRVERPGTIALHIKCPTSTYGIRIQSIEDNDEDFQWPVVQQSGGGYPDGAYVGARGIGHVLVWVTAPTQAAGLDVLATMHTIHDVDGNGCPAYGRDAAPVLDDAMVVCRYDGIARLEQSERLTGSDLEAAEAALKAAPPARSYSYCGKVDTTSVLMVSASWTAHVDLDCGRLDVLTDGPDFRTLTPDVLYWALSPGWTGDGTNLPLPKELRRQ
jgi:hypothetical protein